MQVERPLREGREWRTGEEHVGDLPCSGGYRCESADNPAYGGVLREAPGKLSAGGWEALQEGPASD
ncbi:hypothetical protein KTAU_44700 [Thermogemmatispora aurantia]|uniref:Uncharacterized protein n=1 Tax=Thermogemmatispora aurantia TaxID=2045279 RepID=A0A5J4KKX8_9CHLR|nr:hypothetical protein KTAU_44700 [Thermogemmatispora aurantia]